jgi:D-alanyl-D-alanine dipeptidase
LPQDFTILSEAIPELIIDLKYCGSDNLIGRPLKNYAPDGVAVLTKVAAQSVQKIAQIIQTPAIKSQLKFKNPKLLILDAYRPQSSCEDFWDWSQSSCEKTKRDYYPNIDKKDFFKLGYIARKSSHSRGSTIDLNIVDDINNQLRHLDMGTRFDYMDLLSHPDNREVSLNVYENRQFLKQLMADFGWQGIDQEWWHFTFKDEPYPDTYFDFPVINYLR